MIRIEIDALERAPTSDCCHSPHLISREEEKKGYNLFDLANGFKHWHILVSIRKQGCFGACSNNIQPSYLFLQRYGLAAWEQIDMILARSLFNRRRSKFPNFLLVWK
jgi:hypothetical protein